MKKIIALLMSLVLTLSLCACQLTQTPVTDPTVITTAPSTDPTVITTVPTTDVTVDATTEPATTATTEIVDLLAAAEAKLAQYAVEYDWQDGVVNIILTNVPDFEMFDNITVDESGLFIITMTDGLQYCFTMYEDGIGDIKPVTE